MGNGFKIIISLQSMATAQWVVGNSDCFSTCDVTSGFSVTGECSYCNGYCCRLDGLQNYCNSSVMALVTNQFPQTSLVDFDKIMRRNNILKNKLSV